MMVTDRTVAGWAEASLWQSAAPWLDSVRAARPYWVVRTLSAIPIAAGVVALPVGPTSGKPGAGIGGVCHTIRPGTISANTPPPAPALTQLTSAPPFPPKPDPLPR